MKKTAIKYTEGNSPRVRTLLCDAGESQAAIARLVAVNAMRGVTSTVIVSVEPYETEP